MWTNVEKRNTEDMVYQIYNELRNYGFPLYPLVRIRFTEGVRYLGKCSRNLGNNEVTLCINHAVLDMPNKLKNTILHEICHMIVGTRGHDKVWKHYARVIGIHYDTVIQQYASADAAVIVDSQRKYKHKLTCEYCGREWKFSRAGRVVKYAQTHPNIKCPCGKGYIKYTRIKY